MKVQVRNTVEGKNCWNRHPATKNGPDMIQDSHHVQTHVIRVAERSNMVPLVREITIADLNHDLALFKSPSGGGLTKMGQ